jgi:hypothetical protein
MQQCIDLMLDKLRTRAATKEPVDMTKWFGLLTFDVSFWSDSFSLFTAAHNIER